MDEKKKSLRKTFLAVFGGSLTAPKADAAHVAWRPLYWAYAAAMPAILYAFEALKIFSYPTAQAPNVGLLTQLALMLFFYGLWVLAPRLCWRIAAPIMASAPTPWLKMAASLLALGFALCAAHLMLLTFLLRTMYSPPGWGLSHFIYSAGEVWLGNAGVWLLVYGVATIAVIAALAGGARGASAPARYEVRENGKARLIPLAEIFWVKAAGNYVELHTTRGVAMTRKTLSQVEREIGPAGFIKSHRGALVNGDHVLAVKHTDDGYVIQLSNGGAAPLSRRNLSAFKAVLKSPKDH